jgi:hypothetical protein
MRKELLRTVSYHAMFWGLYRDYDLATLQLRDKKDVSDA